MNITIVTVTYGKRGHLLLQVLDAAKAQGAANAIVIDNGSEQPAAPWITTRYGDWARVQDLGGNKGSATGFKAGMALAQALGAELILLLDDDNLPAPGCLRSLLDKWQNHAACGEPTDSFAVHGLRTKPNLSHQTAGKFLVPRPNSFLGFHVGEIPGRLFRRHIPALTSRRANAPIMRIAPYGGMMFHRDLLARIGLPDESYLLYVDDYEFSSRISAGGGRIHLIEDAVIHDIDSPATLEARPVGSLFQRRLETQNIAGLYYATRNMTFFERYTAPKDHLIYTLNGAVFLIILTIIAFRRQHFLQYRIILQAIRDGDNRLRGLNPAYPI